MEDERTVAECLENMSSHGIFDAEYIAATFREKGWQFVYDKNQDSPSGGAYYVRSPERKEGYVNWFNHSAINQLTKNAAFFADDTGPLKMFLAWIFADQIGRLIFGKAFDEDENGNSIMPGAAFANAYNAFRNASGNVVPPVAEDKPIPLSEHLENEAESITNDGPEMCYHTGEISLVTTNPDQPNIPTHYRCSNCGDLYPIGTGEDPKIDWKPAEIRLEGMAEARYGDAIH